LNKLSHKSLRNIQYISQMYTPGRYCDRILIARNLKAIVTTKKAIISNVLLNLIGITEC